MTGRKTEFMQQECKYRIDIHPTEPERYKQSKVGGVIRETRKKWFRMMLKKDVPKRLWDYGLRSSNKLSHQQVPSRAAHHSEKLGGWPPKSLSIWPLVSMTDAGTMVMSDLALLSWDGG